MANPKTQLSKPEEAAGDEPSQGPSLVVLYSFIALALVLATVIAALIVLPFYLRR
ncbi:MAG: hypothetical protein ACRD27_01590 [Terracidiphilus sp.]